MSRLTYRLAEPTDLATLQRWDEQPHVVDSDPKDDWHWAEELQRRPPWREFWIAELDGRPIGFLQIIDPALEDSHYWGDIGPGYRALDIWIGEADFLGRGHGTEMMHFAIRRCFDSPGVTAILIDPLAANVRAHRFYERLGFRFLERRQFGDDDCHVHVLGATDWRAADG